MMREATLKDNVDIKKLIWLGLMSVILCMSLFMSIFAPYPIAMAMLIFGRAKTFGVTLVGLVLISFLGTMVIQTPHIQILYLVSILIAFAVTEIIRRRLHPVKGFMQAGGSILGLLVGYMVVFALSIEGTVRSHLLNFIKLEILKFQESGKEALFKQQGGEMAQEVLASFANPGAIVDDILVMFPGMAFATIFFWLWAITLMVLRSKKIFNLEPEYRYTEKELLEFKVPEWTIWPLIVLLAYMLGSFQYPDWEYASIDIGFSISYCFAIFYFFQGFGIFISFLNAMKIFGFIRTFFVIFMVLMASKALALIGLFDMWVNFRKYLTPKSNEDI